MRRLRLARLPNRSPTTLVMLVTTLVPGLAALRRTVVEATAKALFGPSVPLGPPSGSVTGERDRRRLMLVLEPKPSRLQDRGFHWVSEAPYNR